MENLEKRKDLREGCVMAVNLVIDDNEQRVVRK